MNLTRYGSGLRRWRVACILFAAGALLLSVPAAFAAPGKALDNVEAKKKVLRIAFKSTETGFDPQRTEDRYSTGIQENIFESLLTYDYLARPVKLVGLSAEAVPLGEEGGTRFTFKIKPGIFFAPDPVFKGKKRELTARDMEYAMKRFRDPTERSPYSWLFENNIVGFDEFVANRIAA